MAEVLSASGYLALLDEPEQALRLYALQMLNQVVHQFWFEIAGSLAAVEAHYEDESFEHQPLAALVASKVRSPVQHHLPNVNRLGFWNILDPMGWPYHDALSLSGRFILTWGSWTMR